MSVLETLIKRAPVLLQCSIVGRLMSVLETLIKRAPVLLQCIVFK